MSTYYYVYPFGENADDLTSIPTPAAGDGSVSYFAGWTDPYEYNLLTNPAALPIPRGQMNQLFYDITNNIQQYQQYGTPAWVTSSQNLGVPLAYPIYARVYYNGVVYENQVAANTATPGTDQTWREISGSTDGVPIGTIIDFAGTAPPDGYLNCDGSAVSTTTYANLFAVLGNTWGASPPSGMFYLPDLERSVTVGSGGTVVNSILGNTVGSYGGEEQHVQTEAELAAHSHPGTVVDIEVGTGASTNTCGNNGATSTGVEQSAVSVTSDGGSSPFNIIQPSAVVTKCIKFA